MEIKVAQKKICKRVRIEIDGENGAIASISVLEDDVRERFVDIILFEVQRLNPEVSFSTINGAPIDYISDLLSLEKISSQQEQAVEELRTKNEEQETRIEMLEKQLEDAQAASENWARENKRLKNKYEELPEEEKPS